MKKQHNTNSVSKKDENFYINLYEISKIATSKRVLKNEPKFKSLHEKMEWFVKNDY